MPTKLNQQSCDCGCNEFYFCKDLNLEPVWKAGNKFCRVCADCGSRYFLAKSMYQQVSDRYIIPRGEDEPVPIFDCPRCEETVTGLPNSCPYCDAEYEWPTLDEETVEADDPGEETAPVEDENEDQDEAAADPEGPAADPDEADPEAEPDDGADDAAADADPDEVNA